MPILVTEIAPSPFRCCRGNCENQFRRRAEGSPTLAEMPNLSVQQDGRCYMLLAETRQGAVELYARREKIKSGFAAALRGNELRLVLLQDKICYDDPAFFSIGIGGFRTTPGRLRQLDRARFLL